MSDEQTDYEELRPDHSRDAFEAALAALRPRVDAAQSRTEFIPFAESSATSLPKCTHPAGHTFVCVHCGNAAPAFARSRRWGWSAALAAMTSAAAVLLAIVLTDRSTRVAVQETKSPAAAKASRTQPTDAAQPSRHAVVIVVSEAATGRLALAGRPGRVLSAADLELRDDLTAADDGPRSAADHKKPNAPMSDGATLRALLGEFGMLEKSTN
jgi:hypothetical protein